jgi:RNA polymerase sigma factor (sigma-70 family)
MIAVHEPDATERRHGSPRMPREALSCRSALDDHEAEQPMIAHDDVVFRALVSDDPTWEDADAAEVPVEDDSASAMPFDVEAPETDNMLAQYFGEVRHFALLSFAEEQALGRRIKRWQRRVCWALYTSPMALPTLRRIWHQIEPQDISQREVVQYPTVITPEQTERRAQARQAILSLQDLATRLDRPEARSGLPRRAAQEGRGLRHARFSLWRAWLTTCEALQLPPHIHEAMREALTDSRQTPPDQALLAASRVWARAQGELDQAKAQMMQANLRFVIHVAQRYGNRGVPLLDLIQEGNLGLMRAVEKFEPRRGLKLITYARWWIRQAISRALSEQHRTIRLPSHVIERQSKLYAATTRLWTSHGRAPSARELSAALGWTPQKVEALLIAVQPIAQLQHPVTDDGDVLQDLVEDTQTLQPDELVAEEQVRRGVRECLGHLTEREAVIVRLRYGLDAHEPHSLQDIGAIYGISRERVRQLEKRAFAKLRRLRQSAVLAELVQ